MQSMVYYEDFDNLTFRPQPFDGQWPVVKSPQWLQQIDDWTFDKIYIIL